jgi:hypothetical protein
VNRYLKPSHLPFVTLTAGVLGLILRVWLKLGGTDEKGLLVTTHPAHILIFVLTALAMAYMLLCVRPLDAVKRYADLFPRGKLACFGCIAAAAGILWVSIRERNLRSDPVTAVCLGLGILAAVCLAVLAFYRFRNQHPPCWFHMLVTLFFMAHLVSQYRLWSPEPQLQVYFFPLLASVFLMLTAYHTSVLDTKIHGRRWFVFCNQSALFFCCVSISSEIGLFYLLMALWLITGLCSLEVQPPEAEKEVA